MRVRVDKSSLSPAAQRLIELVGMQGDVAQTLNANPELMSGLNEYMAWRDRETSAIASTDAAPSVGHSLAGAVRGLPFPKLPKRPRRHRPSQKRKK